MSFFQGLMMGLAYVAPIGVQNLFVINSALSEKIYRALIISATVIFFDVTLSLACFFGVGKILQTWAFLEKIILLVGGIFISIIGIKLLRTKPQNLNLRRQSLSAKKFIATACITTWFNPQAILDGTMILGTFRSALLPEESFKFLFGVMSASCIWFISLTLIVAKLRKHFSQKILYAINVICGTVIIFYALKLLFEFFQKV